MKSLTPKQEAFCRAFAETGNASEAYRKVYLCAGLTPGTVRQQAAREAAKPAVRARIAELKAQAANDNPLQLDASIIVENTHAEGPCVENPPVENDLVCSQVAANDNPLQLASIQVAANDNPLQLDASIITEDTRAEAPCVENPPVENDLVCSQVAANDNPLQLDASIIVEDTRAKDPHAENTDVEDPPVGNDPPVAPTASKLEHALAIATLGFRVFPLEIDGKRPVIDDWPRRASSDPARIRRWWIDPVLEWEQDFNIGVTGGVFLDIDVKHGIDGRKSFADLVTHHGGLPKTLEVATPSGGTHFYFHHHEGVRNSAGKLGPGLDIRGVGGYVVGPGSTIGDRAYRPISKAAFVAPCPAWLADLAGKATPIKEPRHPARRHPVAKSITLDHENAVQRAREFLLEEAELAVEGAGGDGTTFRVAARIKDFGISESLCLELMLEHWNERCSPPWSPEELTTKVANAYRYGFEAVGAVSPEADFGAAGNAEGGKSDESEKPDPLEPQPVTPFDFSGLPRRQWVLGALLMKQQLTVVIAPPGMGKSTFTLQVAVAIVTGRDDITSLPARNRQRVWVFNNEDSKDEMKRRLAAVMIHFGVSWEDMMIDGKPGLFMNSGADVGLKVAKRTKDGRALVAHNVSKITDFCLKNQIDVMSADPFIETHDANENSNEEISLAARAFRQIAQQANCAVMVIHHTNKPGHASPEGRPGDMDSGRGASSLMGVARIVVTLYGTSKEAAKEYGIPLDERKKYLRLDDAKANMSIVSDEPRWFKRVSVQVPDAETKIDMKMESVGILAPVTLIPNQGNQEEILVEDVADALGGESMTVQALANKLRAEYPLYADESERELRRRIIAAFEEERQVAGWSIQYLLLEDRAWGKHFIEVREAHGV